MLAANGERNFKDQENDQEIKTKNQEEELKEGEIKKISIQEFSELAGFPLSYIKKELALNHNDNQISLEDLRKSMINLLDETFKDNA